MLALDGELLARYAKARFGSCAALVNRWPKGHIPPNRSTLHRWLRGESYVRDAATLLCLAGALDLDPVGIWRFDPESFGRLCGRIAQALMGGDWNRLLPALSFLEELAVPRIDWPPVRIAKDYFGRDWAFFDFQHGEDRQRSYFTTFVINPSPHRSPTGVQVWHFAWRTPQDPNWHPYGFVRLAESEIKLFSVVGKCSSMQIMPNPKDLAVETWVGPGAVVFRVASLHPFACRQCIRTADQQPVCVRFD